MAPIANDILRGIVGVAGILAIAFLLSVDRRRIHWPIVIGGLVVQAGFAVLFFLGGSASQLFQWVASLFVTIINFTANGTEVIFGPVLSSAAETENVFGTGRGLVFAFQVLPTIVFFFRFRIVAVLHRRSATYCIRARVDHEASDASLRC